jgi:hypothetical protein
MFFFCSNNASPPPPRRFDSDGDWNVQHDPLLRAMARAVYDACYPTEEWAPVGFDEGANEDDPLSSGR